MAEATIWDLMLTITNKSTWYNKVSDPEIQATWFAELCQEFQHVETQHLSSLFWTAIHILKATAQGSKLDTECTWDDERVCDSCLAEIQNKIRKDPTKYNYSSGDDFDEIFADNEYLDDFEDYCSHSLCQCKSPDYHLAQYVLYLPNQHLPDELRQNLKVCVQEMLDTSPIDWHPNSNEQVRDLIHQSLYPYIKGVSALKSGHIEPAVLENQRYQWLPSEFDVNADGKVKLMSYINNLDPARYPTFIPCIEQTLEHFLPAFESVTNEELTNRQIQVIVKVSSTHLTPDKPHFNGGSWHIEGMPHERIIASGIHYLTVDNITDSYLEFRKPVVINEEEVTYPQSNSKFTEHHYGIESHFDGKMSRYLGLVKCSEAASVVFPNSLQHHVKDFDLGENVQKCGTRIIICLFLIDPNSRIISTADVDYQQLDSELMPKSSVVFTREEAEHHRERLMYQRKYFVDELNAEVYEREYSLCEH